MTLKEYFDGDAYARMAGIELLEIKPGYSRACMEVQDKHLNGAGFCQGGAIFTLADLAFAACVISHLQVTVSTNSNIVFVKSARKGMLYAEAHELVNHQRMPFAEVRITDEAGDLVAVFTSSGYRKKDFLTDCEL